MMPDQSFDPRTWTAAAGPPPKAPVAFVSPPPELRPSPGEPARAGLLGVALSVTILIAGAVAAYAMRPADAAAITAELDPAASASG